MACELIKYPGKDVTLEYFIGCGDAQPASGDYKPFGSLRTKEFNLAWDTTDATDSDSVGSLRENLATFLSLTMSGNGVCRNTGALGANLVEISKHVANPVATGGQPMAWLRMTFPDITYEALMLITTMSRSAPYADVTEYSFEASATASDFGLIVTDTPAPPGPGLAAVTVTPDVATINTPGGTVQLGASVAPSSLSQSVTWVSGTPAIATVSSAGLVTAVADGTVTITAESVAVPGTTDTATITVTNQ